jgi:outer membrane receptor for ferrienterochelin and colicins
MEKKKSKRIVLILILLLVSIVGITKGQSIEGTVMDHKHQAIEGATVYWINTTRSTITDNKGNFSIDSTGIKDKRLVSLLLGFSTDTSAVQTNKPVMIHLSRIITLKEANVNFEKSGVMISMQPIKTEIIGIKELKKAACCNLGESFETNATVDVTYKDALTGSKELQVLGLSGSYIQLLTENASLISGLGITYGLNGIPGTQINAINIVKGPGSVIFGPDAISGMINVDLHDPEKADKWFVNGYMDENLRRELNIDKAVKLNDNISSLFSFHIDDMTRKVDENGDGFLDMPLVRNINFLNKWKYNNQKGLMSQFSYKYLYERRMVGETDYDYSRSYADMSSWGQKLETNRLEFYGRTGYVLPHAKYQSVGLQYSFVRHEQNGYYGIRRYDANQNLLNLRLIYNTELNEKHSLNIGLSLKSEQIEEQFDTLNTDRTEQTPGVFIEDTYKVNPRLTFIIGYRLDQINKTLYHTPRVNMKYSISDQTDLRMSVGTGVRLGHIFAENPALLVSSKAFVIDKNLKAEQAVNYGLNLVHNFTAFYKKGSIGIDVYRTEFKNRIRVDLDKDPLVVNVYSQANGSFSNTFQTEFVYKILKTVELKLAYKYLDVQSNFNGNYLRDPYIAKHRFLTTFSYESFDRKWRSNLGINWVGSKRLPQTHPHFGTENLPLSSPSYTIINTQVTRIFKSYEVYLGAENLFDFKQMTHLLGSDDPYGPYFDAAYIWGPMDGRRVYVGFRYKISH